MNQKQLLILIIVLAVLGGAALMLLKKDAGSVTGGDSTPDTLLGDLPVGEELAQLVIQDPTNTLNLVKREGLWRVEQRDGYPADYSRISRTVLKLRDLKPTQTESVSTTQLARLNLQMPDAGAGGGALVEFRDPAGTPLASLLLGKVQTRMQEMPAQFGGGGQREIPVARWVRVPSDETSVAVVSEPLSDIEARPERWLNKDFFKVEKIQSIDVTYPEATTNSFSVSRETETGSWTMAGLAEHETLETSQTSGFNYALGNPSFNDVVVDPDDAALGLDAPTRIRIETFEGFEYNILAGEKTNNVIPVRLTVRATYPREREPAEDEDESVQAQKDKEFSETLAARDEKLEKEQALEPWTYLVSSWTLDSVLKQRGDLVKEKPPEEEPESGDPVEDLIDFSGSD